MCDYGVIALDLSYELGVQYLTAYGIPPLRGNRTADVRTPPYEGKVHYALHKPTGMCGVFFVKLPN